VGPVAADTIDDLIGYWIVVGAALVPSMLWVMSGGRGVPIVAAYSLFHVVYFGLPILKGNAALLGYDDAEALRCAATVALFLVVATVAAQGMSIARRRMSYSPPDPMAGRELSELIIGGLAVGLAFQGAVAVGAQGWLGDFFGIARAVSLTFVTTASYLFGVAHAQRVLRRRVWIVALLGLAANVLLSWSSLFLVGGLVYLLAAMIGYVLAVGRFPLVPAIAVLVLVSILHAGKTDMREKYWDPGVNYGEYQSATQLPALVSEWFVAGLAVIAAGEFGSDITERTSLIQILLRVQRLSPSSVEFLGGESYFLLPQMLVPRFLDPEKIPSQAAMNLLNVRYGLLSEHETAKTAVGWGLLAESYANFGYFGVIGIGLLVGLYAGGFAAWSQGAPPVSLPALIAIVVLMNLINMEADLAGLVTTSLQSIAAVVSVYGAYRFFTRRVSRRTASLALKP
jgi:hypothetical protein